MNELNLGKNVSNFNHNNQLVIIEKKMLIIIDNRDFHESMCKIFEMENYNCRI